MKLTKKVLIAGTFDIIHPGHIHFINEASGLGHEVHVIVACDKNCRNRGKNPIFSEAERLEIVQSLKGVTAVYLGREDNDEIAMIDKIRPDIILIGSDQMYSIDTLRAKLKNIKFDNGFHHIKVIKSESYYNKYALHSSSLIKEKIISS